MYQIWNMTEQVYNRLKPNDTPIFHSHQGSQYQQTSFQKSLDELKKIHDFYYYNNKRIKSKLKGLSPVEYRTQSINFV